MKPVKTPAADHCIPSSCTISTLNQQGYIEEHEHLIGANGILPDDLRLHSFGRDVAKLLTSRMNNLVELRVNGPPTLTPNHDSVFLCLMWGSNVPQEALRGKLVWIETLLVKTGSKARDDHDPSAVIRACPMVKTLKVNMGCDSPPFDEDLDVDIGGRVIDTIKAASQLYSLRTLEIFKFGKQDWNSIEGHREEGPMCRGWQGTDITCEYPSLPSVGSDA